MAKKREDQRPSTEDVLAAAFEANCREYERKTGKQRETMFAQMPEEMQVEIPNITGHFDDMRKKAGRAGY